jgi:hypothetical protein
MKNLLSRAMKNLTPTACLLLATLLSACGGGGNESGPPDSVQLSLTSVRVGSTGNCVTGMGPEVHVFGGSPPYRLSNSVPQGMQLNKSSVALSGDSFTISFTNGVCLQSMPITVEDTLGRIAQVMVTNGG